MSETEKKLQELKDKYAKDRAEIVQAAQVLESLPEWAMEYYYHEPHFYSLYGRDVSLTFDVVRYQSISGGKKSPDIAFARRLMAEYPALPMVKVSDGCTSFRPAFFPVPERARAEAVAPFLFRVRPGISNEIALEWNAKIGAHVCDFAVKFPLYQFVNKLGTLRIVTDTHRGEVVGYKECNFEPKLGAQRIKWASGGRQYPNDFTLYWQDATLPAEEILSQLV